MTRIRYTAMTSRERDMIAKAANLSATQTDIMNGLCRGDLYEYALYQNLHMDPHAFYKQKKILDEKCERVLPELGIEYLKAQK